MKSNAGPALFPALMKHWRGRRGMSQLDLALAADVSARHVSFLETGRAQPSREMVLRLGTTLSVPLRDQNQLLLAAGFTEAFEEPQPEELLQGPVLKAVELMLDHHEPYPMVVMNRAYDVIRMNTGATKVLAYFVEDPSALGEVPNGFAVLFDPRLARKFVRGWEHVAKALLSRLHREHLERPNDVAIADLLRSLFEYPGVPADWQSPNLSTPSDPFLPMHMDRGDLSVGFFTTITMFNAPQNVSLEELRIESYFPIDDATRRVCATICGR